MPLVVGVEFFAIINIKRAYREIITNITVTISHSEGTIVVHPMAKSGVSRWSQLYSIISN